MAAHALIFYSKKKEAKARKEKPESADKKK
jgi:hypothetical protein